MTDSGDEIRELITKFLTTRSGVEANAALPGDDTSLIASGILDSFSFIDLLLFLESETGRQCDFSDLDMDRLATLRGIVAYFDKASA